jgi:hypothetical protein
MSINLHNNCKEELIKKLEQGLPKIKVKNRMFLDDVSLFEIFLVEQTLPQNGIIRQMLEEYISERPFYDFAYQTLSRELYENQKYESNSTLSLSEIDHYKDLPSTASRLVAEFESLPWKYSLTLQLEGEFADIFSKNIKVFEISDSIKIFTPNDAVIREFPMQSGIAGRDKELSDGTLLTGFTPLQWNTLLPYIQINAAGFIGIFGATATLESVLSMLKAFFGLGIALRLFEVKSNVYRFAPTKVKAFVHRYIENKWQIERKKELDTAFGDTFQDLALHRIYEGKSEQQKVSWIKTDLEKIGRVFRHSNKARKLILASQWLFDSYSTKDELLSFVQTMVVMEILLGEKTVSDLIGLGELLRNRCAYLLGESHQGREDILKEFQRIYDVRSKIVHTGKSRLNFNERMLFRKLQWMCLRVIQKEVSLLEEDLKE